MTRISCFHSGKLHPNTKTSVEKHAPGAEFVDTSEDIWAYCRAFRERWNTGGDWVTIEQDNEIHSDVLPQFNDCDQDFCVFPYWVATEVGAKLCIEGLGCTRFSAALQEKVQLRHIFQDEYRHWDQVGFRVWVTVRKYGYYWPHIHYPIVKHWHDYGAGFYNVDLHPGEIPEGMGAYAEAFKNMNDAAAVLPEVTPENVKSLIKIQWS